MIHNKTKFSKKIIQYQTHLKDQKKRSNFFFLFLEFLNSSNHALRKKKLPSKFLIRHHIHPLTIILIKIKKKKIGGWRQFRRQDLNINSNNNKSFNKLKIKKNKFVHLNFLYILNNTNIFFLFNLLHSVLLL